MKHILAGKTVKPLRNMMARILLEHLTSRRLACACVFLALVLSTVPAGALDKGRSGPIQMPFFAQAGSGTCWAQCGKMLQKGLYSAHLGAAFNYEIYQFIKILKLGLRDGLSRGKYSELGDAIGRGKPVENELFHFYSSVQDKIIKEINRGNPVIFLRGEHAVLVLGYEVDGNGELYLIQHNPGDTKTGDRSGLYQRQKWEDAIKENWIQESVGLIWATNTPDPNRALQSIDLPGADKSDNLYFVGRRTNNDPAIMLHLTFDETSIDGYRWQKPGTAPIENSNHFPKNVNQLFFRMPFYNADLKKSANVKFGIKVYEKDKPSNAAIFTKDIVIPSNFRLRICM